MAGQANDTEKLPWLEPYREPVVALSRKAKAKLQAVEPVEPAKPAPPATPRSGVPLAAWLAAGVAIVGLAAGGGYWIGNRQAPPTLASSPTVTIPVAKVDPIPMPEVDETIDAASVAARPRPARAAHRAARPRKVVQRQVHRAAVRIAPKRPAAAPPMPKAMAVRFIRQGSAGQPGTVIDLGRYYSPRMADNAFKVTAGRYPYLGGLKRVVVPMPPTYGQPKLYALQLGARSATEARQLCDNLVKIRRPCVVR